MEVHHHPNVERKNFKEYLLEGLMIFIAVSMGFFAESFREHIVNNEHEKQYINSFYKDLRNDQKDLPRLLNSIKKQQIQPADSLPVLFTKASTTTPADTIYYFLRKIIRQQGIRAYITDRTIEQIKNAGEMRLIKDRQILDSLSDYYKQVIYIDYLQQTLLGYKSKLLEAFPLILKSSDYANVIDSLNNIIIPTHHVYLASTDPISINKILIQVDDIRALSYVIKRQIESLLNRNEVIEKMIATKYKVENRNYQD